MKVQKLILTLLKNTGHLLRYYRLWNSLFVLPKFLVGQPQ